MYVANGTFYNEAHSISFGEIVNDQFVEKANTWTSWHLIPSSCPAVANAVLIKNFIEIPGADGQLDLTEYLTGRPVFGMRQGSFNFIIDNYHENRETIREKMMDVLHGKKIKMVLNDDPNYYYEGRFDVGNVEVGASNSSIAINYQLDPYKLKVRSEGSTQTIWDTFNFETDYDYYTVLGDIVVNNQTKNFNIYAGDFPFAPTAKCLSGVITVKFGSSKQYSLRANDVVLLPMTVKGTNKLTIGGTGRAQISWRGGSL